MNASEAVMVLTAAATVDKRTIGEADARMWAEILPATIGPRLAVEAVKAYYRENRQMIMPSDVVKYVDPVKRRLQRDGSQIDIEAMREIRDNDAKIRMAREFYEQRLAGLDADAANQAAIAAARGMIRAIEGDAA